MLGLFGALNLGAQSLQTQQRGVEVTGHNLANVNNPAFARQRVAIATANTLPSTLGPQGTGAQIVRINQLRSAILDNQIQSETSVRGFLEAQQSGLQYGQAILGQAIDRKASGTDATLGIGGQHGLAEELSDLFGAFQSLSTNPTSLTERQTVLIKAQSLANQFNQIDANLGKLTTDLNESLRTDVANANAILAEIAEYNQQIFAAENGAAGVANDLRDLRQQKIEELAKLVNIQVAPQANGVVDISIGGTAIVTGPDQVDTLETFDAGGGQILIRTQATGAAVALAGGKLQGTIEARDGALQTLRNDLDALAGLLITQVNAIHAGGFSLTGSTGAQFFTGAGAANIGVNSALVNDPALLQASGVNGAVGDNQVALALAELSSRPQASLGNRTFSQSYAQTVAGFGQALSLVNAELEDQAVVERMLQRQRDSVSGVSLDEEMTNLVKFQRAYDASAKLISTIDQMLLTVLGMKQ